MSTTSSKSASKTVRSLVLPVKMEIGNLEELYAQMAKIASRKRKEFTLDGGEVALVDAAGIQLLIAFIKKLTGMGCNVSWENYSVQVYQMADELGLGAELGD